MHEREAVAPLVRPVSGRERWLTLPNALSVLRLAGVPVFLYLLLVPRADLAALVVLAVGALTDWLDGKLARWLDQTSRIGELLDPAADRLYILAALAAFVVRDIIPLWLAVLLVGRDVVLAGCLVVLRRWGYRPPEVHHVGKAATFCLLYAFPLLLVAGAEAPLAGWLDPPGGFLDAIRVLGLAFLVWGTALYLWSGLLYLFQVISTPRAPRK